MDFGPVGSLNKGISEVQDVIDEEGTLRTVAFRQAPFQAAESQKLNNLNFQT